MTLEEFNQLCDDFNLFRIESTIYNFYIYGYFNKSLYPLHCLMCFQKENGKVFIATNLDFIGNISPIKPNYIVCSYVETAKFFINRIIKKRKEILIEKKKRELENDFSK